MTAETRACVLHARRDLRIETRPLGEPGPGEALVRVRAGGICGSDLHYFLDGGFGAIRLRQPMILGHEVAGVVEALGEGVSGLAVGQAVALNPSHPCGRCRYCREGHAQHCLDMRFWGSAMRMPHVQGGFRERMVVGAAQCVPVGPGVGLGEAALAEPFAVCLHAARQAGEIADARVLVTGCGPIGALTLIAARRAGAAEVVVTDVEDEPLALALKLGAHRAVNVREPGALGREEEGKGRIDVAFECSGNGAAFAQAIAATRPRGTIVQVGVGATFEVPTNALVAKEITWRGSFRFDREFHEAVDLIGSRAVDLEPLITGTVPLADAVAAFELAADRRRAMKVQLAF